MEVGEEEAAAVMVEEVGVAVEAMAEVEVEVVVTEAVVAVTAVVAEEREEEEAMVAAQLQANFMGQILTRCLGRSSQLSPRALLIISKFFMHSLLEQVAS